LVLVVFGPDPAYLNLQRNSARVVLFFM